jgi:hypothetical protein
MNMTKLDFLIDRAATIGGKLAAKLDSGNIPNKGELAFFDACVVPLTKIAPTHGLRTLALQLHQAVADAKAKRALWLTGRAEALKAVTQRRRAKQDERATALATARKAQDTRVIVAAVSARTAALPAGTNKQGLPFVVELPRAWQTAELVA